MKIYSNNKQELVTRESISSVMICFDEVIKPGEEEGTTIYEYDMVRVSFPYDYSSVVSAIINDRYSNDKMQAIINNHLLEMNDSEHEAEFNEMQAWRAHAKEIGHLVCD